MFHTFSELFSQACSDPPAVRVAVAGAEDYSVLQAVLKLSEQGEIQPTLLGEQREVDESFKYCKTTMTLANVQVANKRDAFPDYMVDAHILIQGSLPAKELLKPFTSRSEPYYAGHRLTPLYLCQLSGYHKLIGICCPQVNFPTQLKKDSIMEAVQFLRTMGWTRPNVAVICEQEELDPKLPNTFVASELDRMGINKEIDLCNINGPLTYDVAMDRKYAEVKRCYAERFGRPGDVEWDSLPPRLEGYCSPHCGNFDLLVMPNQISGHLLAHCWSVSLGAIVCPLVIGGRIPVVMRSRGAGQKDVEYTIRLAAEYARRCK